MSFKVIVAGSRTFNDYENLHHTLNYLLQECQGITIISGDAQGADQLGTRYAEAKGYKVMHFPANWQKYGKSAGYKRNEEMAKHADALVAFWDGKSKGTKHMIDIATKKNLKSRVIRF